MFFWICNFEEKQILENVDDIDMRKEEEKQILENVDDIDMRKEEEDDEKRKKLRVDGSPLNIMDMQSNG